MSGEDWSGMPFSTKDELDFLNGLGTFAMTTAAASEPGPTRKIRLLEAYLAHGVRRLWPPHVDRERCMTYARTRLETLRRAQEAA